MPGDIAITLYKDLRCEIIHEATTSAGVWSSSANNFLDTKSGRITFGVQLLSALMRAVKHDPLGRNEFRDILSEFDNIIEYNGPEDEKAFGEKIIKEYSLSWGRYTVLEQIARALTPERLVKMDYPDMKREIRNRLVPNLDACNLGAGGLINLYLADTPVVDRENRLTEQGYVIIQEISRHYRTVDAGRPFS